MKLITSEQHKQMLANGRELQFEDQYDHFPVVKLFTPDAQCTWLLTALYPNNTDIAFGLCDLGMGFPECGDVSLSEIASLRGLLGLPVERDIAFTAIVPLSRYTAVACAARAIVTDKATLLGTAVTHE